LDNDDVKRELLAILEYWLSKTPVYGFRIGNFNLLYEDFESELIIRSDVQKTVDFLADMRELALDHSIKDGLDRLFLLEMRESERLVDWTMLYRNETLFDATVPFTLGNLAWQDA